MRSTFGGHDIPALQKGDGWLAWESPLRSDRQTKADRIRALAKEGHSYVEISRRVGVRYQHVWNVLGPKGPKRPKPVNVATPREFHSEFLLRAGFEDLGEWALTDDGRISPPPAPAGPGVYAFELDHVVVYVGLAQRGLRQRLAQYRTPGKDQSTNKKIKRLIQESLAGEHHVTVLVARPGGTQWNGLPVIIAPGLEAGLIKMIRPKWNRR
jgi:hypothetical protein